jgi:hypothetical protein
MKKRLRVMRRQHPKMSATMMVPDVMGEAFKKGVYTVDRMR